MSYKVDLVKLEVIPRGFEYLADFILQKALDKYE